MKKLAIITTHPIQYYAPVFKLLAKEIELKIFYTWGEQSMAKYDQGFGRKIEWDLPLLDGYDYAFSENTSKRPGTHHFNGIINPSLIRAVQDFKPDAILIYGWAWKSHLNVLRFFKDKMPVYFRGDSTLLDKQKNFKNILRRLFLKWVYKHVDAAFYVGKANKAYFKHFGLKEEQLCFVPHAIDNGRFSKDKTKASELVREQLCITPEEILILFAGKLEPKKNPELLLDAFIKLDLKSVHLLFVGNGVLEGSLKGRVGSFDAAQDDNIKRRIHFTDFQNQSKMPAVYQSCDLFCLPSKGPNETWGLAVNEAMAAGKAILVSDKVGCAIDLVKPTINGEIFKSGDLDDFMNKLKELTKRKEKLAQMGSQSQRMIQDWSFEEQVKAIVDTIEHKHAK